jgi:hypothetical protein
VSTACAAPAKAAMATKATKYLATDVFFMLFLLGTVGDGQTRYGKTNQTRIFHQAALRPCVRTDGRPAVVSAPASPSSHALMGNPGQMLNLNKQNSQSDNPRQSCKNRRPATKTGRSAGDSRFYVQGILPSVHARGGTLPPCADKCPPSFRLEATHALA